MQMKVTRVSFTVTDRGRGVLRVSDVVRDEVDPSNVPSRLVHEPENPLGAEWMECAYEALGEPSFVYVAEDWRGVIEPVGSGRVRIQAYQSKPPPVTSCC